MADKLDIINWSLRLLGKQTLESIDEISGTAELLNDIYDLNRESLLAEFPWTFSLKTVDLTLSGTIPPDYAFEFQLPSDMIILTRVLTNGLDIAKWDWTTSILHNFYVEYTIRVDKLLINLDQVTIEYVFDQTEEQFFDRLFVRTFALLLARETCFTITKDADLVSALDQRYQQELMRSKLTNAASGKRETMQMAQSYRKARDSYVDNGRYGRL